ncbi:Oxidase ustYa [Lasiodiplodia hormozganensis]|uniref:Oxidase ustYa n=1 Tax=Lasiodiplodia hormozganensis TaxID=869390 RepID=A0AA39Z6D8_9PEZI|nr:Oxidase ustYa [Lasiodiplodia hormozganensis]
MDRRHNTTNDASTAKYSHIISSDDQGQFRHSNEKGGLTMVHARLSEETDSTLLDQVDLSEDDDDLRESGGSHGNGSRRRRVRLGPVWLWALHTGLFLMSLMFFVLGATMGPSTRTFVQQFSAYSPALSAIEYETVTFNNTKGAKTAYVGAGPEADKAWEHVTMHMGDQMVDETDMAELGKPHDRLRVTDAATGASGWRMELAVVHQLHCLNLIRKVVHRDHYQSLDHGDLAVSEEKLAGHLEALRMKIMCEADVGVILYQEQPGDDGKFEPDYETQHVCRNWDKVREWAVSNKVADKATF